MGGKKLQRPRLRRCKVGAPGCEGSYRPRVSTLQPCCLNSACVLQNLRNIEEKKKKKQHAQEKMDVKPRQYWVNRAQAAFNAFIRYRDKDLPCICCNSWGKDEDFLTGGKWDAGHFLSRGAYPELSFEELNCHKQLKTCNSGEGNHAKKGRTVRAGYEENLIRKIGAGNVEWLKGPHEPKKYSIDDLKLIEKTYKKKLADRKAADPA